MQPKIRRIRGTWHCLALGVEGLGFNPSDALRDWLERLAAYVTQRRTRAQNRSFSGGLK